MTTGQQLEDRSTASRRETVRRWALLAALLATAAMVWLAGRAVFTVILLAIAVVFVLLVILAAAAALWSSQGRLGQIVAEDAGQPLYLRLWPVQREWWRRLRSRPSRPPESVFGRVSQAIQTTLWNSPQGWMAYSHLQVRMHPDTIAALDAWMPIDEVAARWIRHYADSRRQTKKSSPTARLIIARDTSQPVGLAEVDGSFRYSPPSDMAAEAVADMAGPMQANPAGGHTQMNPPPPRHSPGRGAHTPLAGGADDTVVMDRTEVAGEASGVLVLHRCDANGRDQDDPPIRVRGHSADIGRGRGREVRADAATVSRNHARVSRMPTGWAIEDLGSTCGTRVNGSMITTRKLWPLNVGDVIVLGEGGEAASFRVVAL